MKSVPSLSKSPRANPISLFQVRRESTRKSIAVATSFYRHFAKSSQINSPFTAPEIRLNHVGLGIPADADVLVPIRSDDVFGIRSQDVLRDDTDVAEEEVGVGVQTWVCGHLEALRPF